MEITDYIEIDNPAAAWSQYREIQDQIARLADHPAMGRLGRVHGTRELVINRTPYIAAYRVEANAVLILRVIHSARRWPSSA